MKSWMRRLRQSDIDQQELALLEDELAPQLQAMRSVAWQHAEHANRRYRQRMPRTPAFGWQGVAGWAVATALLAGSFVSWRVEQARSAAATFRAAQRSAAPAVSDEALLEDVQRDLQRAVPAALAPLALSRTPRPSTPTSTVRKD